MELVNILLLAVLGICTGLAVGFIWKNRKKHGCCGGCTNCAGCSGCTHEKKLYNTERNTQLWKRKF